MRWIGLGIFCLSALLCLILTCKQNESLLELSSSDWLLMALYLVYTVPVFSWCTLGLLGLELACFSGSKDWWNVQTYDKLYADISWLGIEIPLCELYLHILKIYPCFDECSWHQIVSCVGFALGNFHCHVACDLIALASQMTSSSCICLLATLCTGAWEGWFA